MNQEPIFKPFGFKKEKLLERMEREGLHGILLTSPENIYYTTRYTVLPSSGNPILYSLRNRLPFFVYISDRGEITLMCWGFSTLGVEFGADQIKGFDHYGEALETLAAHLKGQLGPQSVLGIESTCPFFVSEIVHKIELDKIILIDDLMANLRLIKSPQERDLLRRSTEIIETTLSQLYADLHLGMSRLELMQKARSKLFLNGATGISHLTFTFGKANPEIAIGEVLDENCLVTLDLGGIYLGYTSDNRRYAYTGRIPGELLERYQVMVDIVDRVGERLVPGTKYSDLFQLALDLYRQNNIEPAKRITHIGHNIGLETEEQWITDDPNIQVEEGMVINIELYSQSETGHYIGNEETYLVEASGPTRISVLPREILTVQ